MAGVLAVTPYYNRPSQAGIEAHFRAVAEATDLPVMLYDIPVRSGRKIAHEVLVRLAREVPNIAGVKDAAADVAATARLIAAVPDRLRGLQRQRRLHPGPAGARVRSAWSAWPPTGSAWRWPR